MKMKKKKKKINRIVKNNQKKKLKNKMKNFIKKKKMNALIIKVRKKKYINNNNSISSKIVEKVKGFYDCEYYQEKYYKEFEANPENCDIIRTAYSRFVFGDCSVL